MGILIVLYFSTVLYRGGGSISDREVFKYYSDEGHVIREINAISKLMLTFRRIVLLSLYELQRNTAPMMLLIAIIGMHNSLLQSIKYCFIYLLFIVCLFPGMQQTVPVNHVLDLCYCTLLTKYYSCAEI